MGRESVSEDQAGNDMEADAEANPEPGQNIKKNRDCITSAYFPSSTGIRHGPGERGSDEKI